MELHRNEVLLVEDSVDDVLLTKRALRKAGITASVHICTNGDEGIAYLASVPPPCLVLLDWKLPRRSGAEVLQWIRENPALRALPVIVVSSSRLQDDIEAAIAGGADAFLEKPLQHTALLSHLHGLGLGRLCAEARP